MFVNFMPGHFDSPSFSRLSFSAPFSSLLARQAIPTIATLFFRAWSVCRLSVFVLSV